MKRIFFSFLYASRVHALLHLFTKNTLTIVLYHGVAPAFDCGIYNWRKKFIDPKTFERQLLYLRQHFRILDLGDAVRSLEKGTLPPRALAITFDDGYKNLFTFAFPILKKYNIPATVFVTTDFVEHGTPLWVDRLEYTLGHAPEEVLPSQEAKIEADREIRAKLKRVPELRKEALLAEVEERCGKRLRDFEADRVVYAPLSWHDLKEMEQYGIVAEAHTKSHPILTNLPATHAEEEIRASRESIAQHLGRRSSLFAYPNGQEGDFNTSIETIVRVAHFHAAVTTIPGWNTRRTNPLALFRMSMDDTEHFGTFVVTVSGLRMVLERVRQYAKRSRLF